MSFKAKNSDTQANQGEIIAKNQFQYLLVSLFLCILAFFAMMNFYSTQNNKKTEEIIDNIKNEFRLKNIKQKMRLQRSEKPYLDGFSDNEDLYFALSDFLDKQEKEIPLKATYYRENFLIHVSENSLFDIGSDRRRKASERFLRELSNHLFNLSSNYKFSIKILFNSKNLSQNSTDELDVKRLRAIYSVFERAFSEKHLISMDIFSDKNTNDDKNIIFLIKEQGSRL